MINQKLTTQSFLFYYTHQYSFALMHMNTHLSGIYPVTLVCVCVCVTLMNR